MYKMYYLYVDLDPQQEFSLVLSYQTFHLRSPIQILVHLENFHHQEYPQLPESMNIDKILLKLYLGMHEYLVFFFM